MVRLRQDIFKVDAADIRLNEQQIDKAITKLLEIFSKRMEDPRHRRAVAGYEIEVFLAWQTLLDKDVVVACESFSIAEHDIPRHVTAGTRIIVQELASVPPQHLSSVRAMLTPPNPTRAEAAAETVPPHQSPILKIVPEAASDETPSETSEDNFDETDLEYDEQAQDEPAEQETEVAENDYDKSAVTTDTLRWYLKQIGKVPLLNAEQEVELAKCIEAGLFAAEKINSGEKLDPRLKRELEVLKEQGMRAKNHFVAANLRLVARISRHSRYQDRGLTRLELIQEGSIGLIKAVEKFDYAKGYKFSTYAAWWIKRAMARAIADQGHEIRIPMHVEDDIERLGLARHFFMQDHNQRMPTARELAEVLTLPEAKVEELIEVSRRDSVSLSLLLSDDSDTTLGDLIEDADAPNPQEVVDRRMSQELFQQAIADLMDRSQLAARWLPTIVMRYGIEVDHPIMGQYDINPHRRYTYEEIGNITGKGRDVAVRCALRGSGIQVCGRRCGAAAILNCTVQALLAAVLAC